MKGTADQVYNLGAQVGSAIFSLLDLRGRFLRVGAVVRVQQIISVITSLSLILDLT